MERRDEWRTNTHKLWFYTKTIIGTGTLVVRFFNVLVFMFDVLPQLALVRGLPEPVRRGIEPALELKPS